MKRSTLIFGLGFLSLALACAPTSSTGSREAAEGAIRAADASFEKAGEARDLAQFVSFYAADATVFPPNGPMITTPEGIKKSFGEMLALPGFGLSWQATKAEASASGDLGYTQGTYRLTANGPDGKPMEDRGKYVTVWKKEAGGSWKVVADIFNSDLPAPAPPAAAAGAAPAPPAP